VNHELKTPPVVLTIAGSDSGGGAGIQADIKSIQANGAFAASAITAVTAQNTQTVTAAYELPLSLIEAQIDAVCSDMHVKAAKTGMLSSADIIKAVVQKILQWKLATLVVDPVMVSTTGYVLLEPEAIEHLKSLLLPLATVITPNLHEANLLTGLDIRDLQTAREAARRIYDMGPQAVLVKGGHMEDSDLAIDVLYDGDTFDTFAVPFIDTPHTHGTGCTYSAAIAAHLARGRSLHDAVRLSKTYVTEAIRHGLDIGKGSGPTNHFYFLDF
jgi:hydroxymethylpyrimidine/phosphomethylpyrimidine kinase